MKTKERGITLIALVVTIIVLLILAGISIQMLTGETGLLRMANEAKIENKKGEYDEALKIIGIDLTYEKTNEELTAKEYLERFKSQVEKDPIFLDAQSIELNGTEDRLRIVTEEGYIYDITENGVNKGKINGAIITIADGEEGENGYYRSNVKVKIEGSSDDISAIQKITYELSGATIKEETEIGNGDTIEIVNEGETMVTAYTYDKTNNRSEGETLKVKKDTIAPTLTLKQIDTTTKEYSKEVEAIATDETSDIQIKKYANREREKKYFTTDGTVMDSNNITLKSEDLAKEVLAHYGPEYKYTFYAKDNAGNETIKTIELQNILLDIVMNGLNGICFGQDYASVDQSTGEVTTKNGTFGPYWALQKGRYKITYYGENLPIIQTKYALRSLYDSEGSVSYPITLNENVNPNEVSYEVTVDKLTTSCELMLGSPGADGSQTIKIKNVRIIQLN